MENIKFIFARDEENFPIGCFAYVIKEGPDVNMSTIRYAYSIYYLKDTFNKKIARDCAAGRLFKVHKELRIHSNFPIESGLANILENTSLSTEHPWSFWKGAHRELGHKFKHACALTAANLRKAIASKEVQVA